MRQIRETLRDEYYTAIGGSTDSEHIFALFLNFLHGQFVTLETIFTALRATICQVAQWADELDIRVALNLAVTNGEYVAASRFSNRGPAPSLYYVKDAGIFPLAGVIASERLWASETWTAVPEDCILGCDASLEWRYYQLERGGAA
jgi:predicted glutamine amidotransferase